MKNNYSKTRKHLRLIYYKNYFKIVILFENVCINYFNIRTKDGIKEIDLEEEKWRLAGRNSVRRKTQESN